MIVAITKCGCIWSDLCFSIFLRCIHKHTHSRTKSTMPTHFIWCAVVSTSFIKWIFIQSTVQAHALRCNILQRVGACAKQHEVTNGRAWTRDKLFSPHLHCIWDWCFFSTLSVVHGFQFTTAKHRNNNTHHSQIMPFFLNWHTNTSQPTIVHLRSRLKVRQ